MALSKMQLFDAVANTIAGISTIGLSRNDVTLETRLDELDSLQSIELHEGISDVLNTRLRLHRFLRFRTVGDVVDHFDKKRVSARVTSTTR